MIIREFFEKRYDGVKLYRTISDAGFYIKQVETGHIYTEAIDVEGAPYTYDETTTPIERMTDDPDKTDNNIINP